MRSSLAIAVALAACSGPAAPLEGPGTVRHDLHCTIAEAGADTECGKKGPTCALGPPLVCTGVPTTAEERLRHDAEVSAGTLACHCICEDERRACAEVP
jgi:hypothetical protein